jgi:preprotein translocase subunit SecD
MSLFKEKRILLLGGICLLAVVLLVTPGIRYGIDIAGGSRIVLELEASQATIQLVTPIVGDNLTPLDDIARLIMDNLLTSVKVVSLDRTANTAVFEIGRSVSSDVLDSIIDNMGQVISIEGGKISDQTREEVTNLLQTRVDPAGLLGVQSRPMGANLVLFEVPAMDPERAKALLGQTGRLEEFIENTLVLTADDIEAVGSIQIQETSGVYKYEVPLTISQDGANKFAAAAQGKGDYPIAIYLDRPDDAVLLFNNQLLTNMPTGLTYDNTARTFRITISGTQGVSESHSYDLLVSFIPISKDNLDNETLQTIQEMYATKNRAIFLGSVTDFSENVTGSVKAIFTENNVEYLPKTPETETTTNWLQRACGLKSAPAISQGLADGVPRQNVEISGSRGTYESAESEASDLKTVLQQRLPVKVSFVGESSIPARLGSEFAFDILKAAIAAVIAVGVLVYLRYRRPLIVGAIMLTMGSEVLVTIGIASGLRQTIGLAEIAAVLAVIGTGVEQQLIITDEVLRRGLPKAGPRPMSLSGRIAKAFVVIFAAAATTIAALATLFFVGYGAMKGFAIVMIIGILAAILVTRPAYGRIVNTIVSREAAKAEKTQVKAAQQ